MSDIPVRVGMDFPNLEDTNRIHVILGAGLKKIGTNLVSTPFDSPLWNAEFHELHRSTIFQEFNDEQKQDVLTACSRHLLEEALYIEQNGMAFAAKMSLLSQSVEERMLYNLFASEETQHYSQIRSFLPERSELGAPNAFHHLLSELISCGDRDSLVFVIQVILEGWGLTHYKSLAKDCQNSELKCVLQAIVRDEARHHGSGVILCRQRGISPQTQQYTLETLVRFLEMVQIGPQGLLSAMDEAAGGLTKAQKLDFLVEIGAVHSTSKRLEVLRLLMEEDGFAPVVNQLQQFGCFRPYTPEECL